MEKEMSVGEVFTDNETFYNKRKFICVIAELGCKGCVYPTMFGNADVCSMINCIPNMRKDNNDVIFIDYESTN